MSLRRAFLMALLSALVLCPMAEARDGDGVLHLIRAPHEGMPALVTPGADFDAELTEQQPLFLSGAEGESVPLEVEWMEGPGPRVRARCTVPPDVAAGSYALDAGDGLDRVDRAVFVREAFPEAYAFAHVADPRIGAEGADAAFSGIVEALNESAAAFVLMTGNLTDEGAPDQFQRFLEILNRCDLPTFVSPGGRDRAGAYADFFGPPVHAFTFGEDGFLLFATGDARLVPEGGDVEADLEILRRRLKPCRWTVGATHRYDIDMEMRAQIVLFVDNPLDHLLAGPDPDGGEGRVPWGTTPYSRTPAARDAKWRLVVVTRGGVKPAPVE